MKRHPIHPEWCCDSDGELYKNGRHIIGTIATVGYRQYSINRKSRLGHRLVMECRIGRELLPEEVVNHKDFNKVNNAEDNLEIVTHQYNRRHYWNSVTIDTSNIDMNTRLVSSGDKNSMAKLTNAQAESLILDLQAGMDNNEASAKYGLHARYISLIRHKKRWKIIWKKLGLESSTTIPSGSTL